MDDDPEAIILGVDTHKDIHVVAALDSLGRLLATAEFGTDRRGAATLLEWARRLGMVRIAGVEGTASYGYALTRHLVGAGVTVVEVNRPDRSRRRRRGKSDPADAEAAARAVLSRDATAVPKDRSGPVGELRALTIARRSAVKSRTQATNQLRALSLDCDDALRGRLKNLRDRDLALASSRLRATSGLALALRSLGRRWLLLNQEILELDTTIGEIVRTSAPDLLTRPGVGIHSAAQLLVTAGDNPERLASEATFAALCGTSPVDASSGQTHRHRLNRGGDRGANSALWTIAHVRLVHDERTRVYASRRRSLGSSRKEILPLLKRYIVRELYPIILRSLGAPTAVLHQVVA